MHAPNTPLVIHRIFHPTDFSADSQVAFAHALKLAVAYRAELTIMHVILMCRRKDSRTFPRTADAGEMGAAPGIQHQERCHDTRRAHPQGASPWPPTPSKPSFTT